VICCLFAALLVLAAAFLPRPAQTAAASVPAAPVPASAAPVVDPHDLAMWSTKIVKYHGRKDELGMVLYETFTVKNDGPAAVKDLKIKCENEAPSGTALDSNTRIIYEIVPAHKTRTFANFNMGLINPQTSRSGCQIEDLALAN
jgi:hypothetical protein